MAYDRLVENGLLEELKTLPSFKRLYITGHSMGGALATIMQLDCLTQGISSEMVSFGSPRLGNADFERLFNEKLIADTLSFSHRVVARSASGVYQDGITMAPPIRLGYARPIVDVIDIISPACDDTMSCLLNLHDMAASYVPALQAAYP